MNRIANLLTIFGNIRVEGEQKYVDLETTIKSMEGGILSELPWVLNLRGTFASKAETLIRTKFGLGPQLFRVDDDRGWHFVTNQLLGRVETPLLYSFLEDHCYSGSDESLCGVLTEMIAHKIDHLMPYRFSERLLHALEKKVPLLVGDHLSYVDLTVESILSRNDVLTGFSTLKYYDEYLIGLPGFFSVEFYRSRVGAFKMGFAQYHEQTPFDFEQSSYDHYVLPVRFAYSRNKIFSCIDDDFKVPGTSLVSNDVVSRRERVENQEVKTSQEISLVKVQTSGMSSFLFKYSKNKGRYAFLRPNAISRTGSFVGCLSRVLRDHVSTSMGITHAVVIAGCAGFIPLIFLAEAGEGLRLMAVEQQLDSYRYLVSNLELRKATTPSARDSELYPIRYPFSKFDTPDLVAKVQIFLGLRNDSDYAMRRPAGLAVFIGDIYNYKENIMSLLWLVSIARVIVVSRPELMLDYPAFAALHVQISMAGFRRYDTCTGPLIDVSLFPGVADTELPPVLVYGRS